LKLQEKLERSHQQHKSRNEQHREYHKFYVGYKVWIYLYKERLQRVVNKLYPLRYKPFDIIVQGNIENAFRMRLRYLYANDLNGECGVYKALQSLHVGWRRGPLGSPQCS